MTKQRLWLALLVLIASLTQCSSCKENVNPNELPSETQTGAGTFACLINGQVWRYNDPKGNFSLKPTTSLDFNPLDHNGRLDIYGLRYDANDVSIDQINLGADSLNIRSVAKLNFQNDDMGLIYSNAKASKCTFFSTKVQIDSSKNFYRQGKIIITKLDTQTKIISGRFDFTIFQTGCDTLKITEGRFDFKYK
jgi:Family of unknown function (DUF6252)